MEIFKKVIKVDSIIIILSIILVGYFGIFMINKNYNQTVELAINNSFDQSKINNANKNFLRFVLCDEKSFSEALSGGDESKDKLGYYKNELLSGCEDSMIDKKLIDSLFNKKLSLLKEFECISSDHIRTNMLYKIDTTHKALKFIGKSKITYKVDPIKLKSDIQNFDHKRNNELERIIVDNFEINFLISKEVNQYVGSVSKRMTDNRTDLINEIDRTLNRFIICIILVISIIGILIKILLYDVEMVGKFYERNIFLIKSLVNRIFKRV